MLMNSLIMTSSKVLESYWPSAWTDAEFKDRMLDYYNNKWNLATKKSVLVVQGQLTPDNDTITNALKPFSSAPTSLKKLWENWRPIFIEYLPYFFRITGGSVIMTDFIDSSLATLIIEENIK